MIEKDTIYSWGKKEKDVFSHTKQAIVEVPALYNPKFNMYFLLYTFSSDTSLTAMLTKKDELNNERLISFVSVSLQGPNIKYPTMGKKAFIMYKVVKHFRPYLLKNPCIVFMLHPTVRAPLVQ